MARQLANFLREWCQLFVNTEVPDTYALWSGIWTISSALRDKIYMSRGASRLYPNIYLLLIGPAGGGKSTSAELGVTQLEALGIELFKGRMTESRLLYHLQGLAQMQALNNTTPSAKVLPVLSLYSDELANTVGSGDMAFQFLRIMTQLYGSGFDYNTHVHGLIKVDRPVISWLALATLPWLRRSLPKDLIDSGFVARLIAQKETLSDKIYAKLTKFPHDRLQLLLADLVDVSLLEGEYYLSSAADQRHDEWYNTLRRHRQSLTDEITQGIHGREDEQVMKVSMCLMASTGESPEITLTALNNAITLVTNARASSLDLFRSLAAGDRMVDYKEYVRSKLAESNGQPMQHSELMRRTRKVLPDAEMFRRVITSLKEESLIEIAKGMKSGVWYKPTTDEETA